MVTSRYGVQRGCSLVVAINLGNIFTLYLAIISEQFSQSIGQDAIITAKEQLLLGQRMVRFIYLKRIAMVWSGKDLMLTLNIGNLLKIWKDTCLKSALYLLTPLETKWLLLERMQSGGGCQPWEHLYTLPGYHKRTIFSVHWSSEGTIATGAADGAIYLFEENRDGLSQERRGAMKTRCSWPPSRSPSYRQETLCKLFLTKEKANETEVTAVQWAPEEIGLLASSSDDGTVKIWKLTYHHIYMCSKYAIHSNVVQYQRM
ncbi:hypothetical protein POM88_004909 [Heracleum sosnowskyi]|uniref:Uncharacterized protein n=1 Tax=Heracleum sosnowskyi TaxID=360622 RepID=A0AAD8ND01_9APIA|nr:hypothetical protein POM88_004909 [Heracleum sosnowskyi]